MAERKPKRQKRTRELPPPLPPGERTIGQLVAETIRFYGRHFWRSLALGIGPAAVTVAGYFTGFHPALAAVVAGWILLASASFVGACVLVSGTRPPRDVVLRAFVASCLVALPFLVGLLWLAPIGLAVPAIVNERLEVRPAFRRGLELAKADFVHALGSLATLLLVVFLTQTLLTALLHGASQQSVHISAFLASLVLQPILFLGAAMLYDDQAARVEIKSGFRNPRRPDADVPHADDADRPGSADAPIQP
ncbi:MAG TPA: hypothetical protein VLJ76_06315 [Gaiellaceae bacterium]|nr:hypothetical protein [Gaiellaceae bacterium]